MALAAAPAAADFGTFRRPFEASRQAAAARCLSERLLRIRKSPNCLRPCDRRGGGAGRRRGCLIHVNDPAEESFPFRRPRGVREHVGAGCVTRPIAPARFRRRLRSTRWRRDRVVWRIADSARKAGWRVDGASDRSSRRRRRCCGWRKDCRTQFRRLRRRMRGRERQRGESD